MSRAGRLLTSDSRLDRLVSDVTTRLSKTIWGRIWPCAGIFYLLCLPGCIPASPPAPPDSPVPAPNEQAVSPTEEIKVTGFDAQGEPVIRRWSDGTLTIEFSAMPPHSASPAAAAEKFADFERRLQEALGVPVVRKSDTVFLIENSKPETAQKARVWLSSFHSSPAQQPGELGKPKGPPKSKSAPGKPSP